jgi:hypothetical protein
MSVSACTRQRPLSSECVFNGDCQDPLVCAGGFCRAQCQSDRDCPSGTTCEPSGSPGKTVCVPVGLPQPCLYSSDCAPPLACGRDGVCRAQCIADTDCLSTLTGLVCEATPALEGGVCTYPDAMPAMDAVADADGSGAADAGDAAMDAGMDVATDGVTDAAMDAATDAVADAAMDAATDSVIDATTDAAPDAADAADAADGTPCIQNGMSCATGVCCSGNCQAGTCQPLPCGGLCGPGTVCQAGSCVACGASLALCCASAPQCASGTCGATTPGRCP